MYVDRRFGSRQGRGNDQEGGMWEKWKGIIKRVKVVARNGESERAKKRAEMETEERERRTKTMYIQRQCKVLHLFNMPTKYRDTAISKETKIRRGIYIYIDQDQCVERYAYMEGKRKAQKRVDFLPPPPLVRKKEKERGGNGGSMKEEKDTHPTKKESKRRRRDN